MKKTKFKIYIKTVKEKRFQSPDLKKKRSNPSNKYDFSPVKQLNNHTKVIIKCDEHGFFEQLPSNHICVGSECPKCPYENSRKLSMIKLS